MGCNRFATPDVCEWELGLRARHVSTQISSGGWSDPASGINTIWTIGEASQETLPVALIGLLAQYYWGRHHKNKTLPVPVALIPWKGRRPAVGEDPIKKHFKKTAVSSLGTTSKIMKAWCKRQHSLNNVLSCNWLCLVSSFEKYFFFRHFESCYETRVRV